MATLPTENIYGHTKKLRFILDNLKESLEELGAPVSVLDFGCGNGSAVSQFLIQDGVELLGVDIHQPSLEHARAHHAGDRAVFSDRIPADRRFHVVVYADILEHLEDPGAVLRDHHGRLEDGGVIVGAIPNGYGPFENETRIARWLGLTSVARRVVGLKRRLTGGESDAVPYNLESGHLQFFSSRAFIALLEDSGYRLERFRNQAFAGAPLSERLFLRGERIAAWNTRIADFLPRWAVSTWMFRARKLAGTGPQPRNHSTRPLPSR